MKKRMSNERKARIREGREESIMANRNNVITVTGTIEGPFSAGIDGRENCFIRTGRLSGTEDVLAAALPLGLSDPSSYEGRRVTLTGIFRSANATIRGRRRLLLDVCADELYDAHDGEADNNSVTLKGTVCKVPIYRQTPLGREVTDIIIAVNNPDGSSCYIPALAWFGDARLAGGLKPGDRVSAKGRAQSRMYLKTLADGTTEERTAYEVSIANLEVENPAKTVDGISGDLYGACVAD